MEAEAQFKEENIMAMVVQHNLTAMNANRQLGVTTGAQAKSSEKLSSGYRINRAGDDAAGLKISEKMRSQIRGLDKASANAQDGVSLIQTAEGALNEAHSILQRMNELAVQGANDTNQSIDRDAINQELSALTTEIDRIAQTTQFNKQSLLDGTFADKNLQVGANTNQKIQVTIKAMNATAIGLNDEVAVEDTVTKYRYKDKVFSNKKSAMQQFSKSMDNQQITGNKLDAQLSKDVQKAVGKIAGAGSKSIIQWGDNYYLGGDATTAFSTSTAARQHYVDTRKEGIVSTVKVATQGKVTAPTVSTYAKANATLSKVQNAINNVSSQRSALGALQNRLEHTIANLDNVSENTQSAESRIRDTDMASEMVNYSKNNILAQAGQSMLAQANQSTQGVLSLLQ